MHLNEEAVYLKGRSCGLIIKTGHIAYDASRIGEGTHRWMHTRIQ